MVRAEGFDRVYNVRPMSRFMESSEPLYEYVLRVTGVVEYGASLQAIVGGKAAPPPQGAQFDISFEGSIDGPKLKGSVRGVDYANIRADGRVDLHIHELFDLTDGGKVAVFADGIGTLDAKGILHLRENVSCKSSSPAYVWVNSVQVWGIGTANLAAGEIRVKGYKA